MESESWEPASSDSDPGAGGCFRANTRLRRRPRQADPGLAAARDKYALTVIYLLMYIQAVNTSFAVIAEPNRRAILSLLLSSERSVGELERKLRLSQPSVSKHLRVLREAGFVESRTEAQQRVYQLRPEPLMELDEWLAPFRRFWSKHLDALERHLDKMDTTPTQRGKKKS